MQIATRIQGIHEYYFSKKLREIDEMNKQGKQVINLGIGNPDLPPHASVIKTFAKALQNTTWHGYQNYKGIPELRSAIATWYKKYYKVQLNENTEILPLIGSKEGIVHICMSYLNKNDVVLVPNPGYPTYTAAAKMAEAKIEYYNLQPNNQWQIDLDNFAQQIIQYKPVLVFINYPHMPTGTLPSKQLFKKLVALAHKYQFLLVNDNPYSFILNNNPLSCLQVSGAKDVVIELNSLSKSHNMAGWRIGMACSSEKHINQMLQFKSNMDSGMLKPMQLAAAKALALPKKWYANNNAQYLVRKNKVIQLLNVLGATIEHEQAGLFIWAKKPSQFLDGFDCSNTILQKANVFITPGGIFGSNGNNYIRVSLCNTEQILQNAIDRIQQNLV